MQMVSDKIERLRSVRTTYSRHFWPILSSIKVFRCDKKFYFRHSGQSCTEKTTSQIKKNYNTKTKKSNMQL